MGGWNYADVWEAIAAVDPDAPAQVQGGRRLSWGDLDRSATLTAEPGRPVEWVVE